MKNFLFLALIALFAMLPFSCSNGEFKEPQGSNINGGEPAQKVTIICVIDADNSCREITANACAALGGKPGSEQTPPVESCKNPFVEWETDLDTAITEYMLSFKGIVKITEEGIADEKKFDSVVITNNFSFDIEYKITGDSTTVDFENIAPVDMSDETIPCQKNKINFFVYAGGEERGEMHSITFERPKIFCRDEYPIPTFTCGWDPAERKYGDSVKPSLLFNDNNCTGKMYVVNGTDTTWFATGDSVRILEANGFPMTDKDTSFVAKGFVTCEENEEFRKNTSLHTNCVSLTIKPTPAPINTGTGLSINPDYTVEGVDYLYGGKKIKDIIDSNFIISNDMCGTVNIEPDGETAIIAETLTPMMVYATVTCNNIPYKIDSAEVTVIPYPKLESCELDEGSYPYMAKSDTLKVKAIMKNDYHGRCASTLEYRFSGADGSWLSESLFPLKDRSSGAMSNIKARAMCNNKLDTIACPVVTVVDNHYNIPFFEYTWDNAESSEMFIDAGISIIEFDTPYAVNEQNDTTWIKTIGCNPQTGGGEDYNYKLNDGPLWTAGTATTNSNTYWKETIIPVIYKTNGNRFLLETTGNLRCVVYYRNPV